MGPDVWSPVDVTGWTLLGVQQTGSSMSQWLEEPGTRTQWLHKDTVIPKNGLEQGEDWSEVVSTQVARALGVPCAETRMCVRNGRRGSISRSVVPTAYALYSGAAVLELGSAPGYFPHREGAIGVDPARPGVKRPGHTLQNIHTVLETVGAPPGFEGPESLTAFDVFCGYLVLDALIANRDRHEENWAVLTPQLRSDRSRLSPSYDHASSLGYNLLDSKRQSLVAAPDRLRAWTERGTAWRYEHRSSAPTLVEHAVAAMALGSADGAHWWRSQVLALDLDPVLAVLRRHAVASMSDLAVTFACDLLNLNLRRLRGALD